MIKFENTITPSADQWKAAIMGARNPMNSWDKSDSGLGCNEYRPKCGNCGAYDDTYADCGHTQKFIIGPNDLNLLKRLCTAGTDHRKFMRMLPIMVTITAPLYWWKEFDTYKVGTVANSCSTMHKIAAKEFTLEDFSTEHLFGYSKKRFYGIIDDLNYYRNLYLNGGLLDFKKEVYGDPERVEPKDKRIWWQIIQLLPSSYNQKRTVMMNYEVLANIYKSRKNHKLDEWSINFIQWVKSLPQSELITGKFEE